MDGVLVETAWVENLGWRGAEDRALPGALEALTQPFMPVAVVTSAGRALAVLRLQRAELPVPAVLVCADDVARGKPHPEPYLHAADLLGVPISRCVGVEDTPTGLASIVAAGATGLALDTSYASADLHAARAVLSSLAFLQIAAGELAWSEEDFEQ